MIPVCEKPAEVETMLHVKNYLVLLWTPSWKEQAQDEKLVILLPEELLELEEEPSWEEQQQDGKLILLLPKELIESRRG